MSLAWEQVPISAASCPVSVIPYNMCLVTLIAWLIAAYTAQFLSDLAQRALWKFATAGYALKFIAHYFVRSTVLSGCSTESGSSCFDSARPSSGFSGSEVSLVDFDDGSLLMLVVYVCSSLSPYSSRFVGESRGPAVTFDKMQVS